MKKRNIIICSISIGLIISLIVLLGNNKCNVFEESGVTYALTVDGVKQNNFPSKGLYRVDTECSNATCKWDYDAWKLYIEKVTGDVSCDITFTTITKTNLNNYIISLSDTNQGTGSLVHETFTNTSGILVDTGYRYEGKNPNNWVWFNNELWRIIGVFDAETHGQTGLNLVKIIRANSIGGIAWDKLNSNNWANSSLYKLLNPVSGDASSGTYYNKENGNGNAYCYMYSNIVPGNCDYSNIGIDATYRSMIKNVTWKVGGHSTNAATAETFYAAERGSITGNSNKYAKEVTGYIGLMYASDYGYSVLASSCARTRNLNAYNWSACTGQSWLGGQGYEWTLTPISSNSYVVFHITNSSSMYDCSTRDGCAARPSLYLDANVYVIDGEGTEVDPYIIGM